MADASSFRRTFAPAPFATSTSWSSRRSAGKGQLNADGFVIALDASAFASSSTPCLSAISPRSARLNDLFIFKQYHLDID